MARIHSYVVRYDSGFAPNPFYGFCTLATCKPSIRKFANIGDWIVGSGSNERNVRRGGNLVYAMRITETLSFTEYDADKRFLKKKPYRQGSRKQSCGDNIYYRNTNNDGWLQRDSFHTDKNGQLHPRHVQIDTEVDRVLISDDFLYFGGDGPQFPKELLDAKGRWLCKTWRGTSCFDDPILFDMFINWIRSFGVSGYQGPPFEWMFLRRKT